MHSGQEDAPNLGESQGVLSQKIFKFRVSEMPSPAFSAGYSQEIMTKENAVISCLFYPSLVLLVRYSVYGKKG